MAASFIPGPRPGPWGSDFETPGVAGCVSLSLGTQSPLAALGWSSLREKMGLPQVWGSGAWAVFGPVWTMV